MPGLQATVHLAKEMGAQLGECQILLPAMRLKSAERMIYST
jgi:hypothetical protein